MGRTAKLLLLGVSLLVAVALASPSGALAVKWIHQGEALAKEESFPFEGEMNFSTLGTGLGCEIEGIAWLKPGNKGEITAFTQPPESCEGFGFIFEECTVVEVEAVGLPWTIEAQSLSEITILGFGVSYELKNCPYEGASINSIEDVYLVPENGFIAEPALTGTVATSVGAEAAVEGFIIAEPTNTFGLE